MSDEMDKIERSILPIPDRQHVGLTTYDAKDPDTKFPAIEQLRPDLVLMDWTMEGMSGLEATRQLKSRPLAPRVVLVTGSDTPEYRRAALAAQADGFLAKPDLLHGLAPLVGALFGS